MFSPGALTPAPSHGFCFLLSSIDIHSNYHHSPLETSLFPQFGVVLRHAIPCPKNDRIWHLKGGRQFVTLPLQNGCRLNLWHQVTENNLVPTGLCVWQNFSCALDLKVCLSFYHLWYSLGLFCCWCPSMNWENCSFCQVGCFSSSSIAPQCVHL